MPLLLIFLFLAGLLPATLEARVIRGEERWQGEVRVDEPLRVETGGRLLIAPGTQILARAGIEIAGGIEAQDADFSGDNWPGLTLKGLDRTSRLSGCRIRGAATGITVIGGEPQLAGLVLEQNRIGIELRQKSRALVENSVFKGNERVGLFLKDGVEAVVRGNRFEGQGKFGAYIYRAQPREFSRNRFSDNPVGLMISHFGSDPRIVANEFRRNQIGIKVDRTARPHIRTNLLADNQTGIELFRRADPRIEGNRLQHNRQAIHISFSSYPEILGNDFVDNERGLFLEFQSARWEARKGEQARQEQLSTPGAFGGKKQDQVTEEQRRPRSLDGTVDARNNWWGAAETRQLRGLSPAANLTWIDDGLDRPTFEEGGASYPLDKVRWHPYAEQALTDRTIP